MTNRRKRPMPPYRTKQPPGCPSCHRPWSAHNPADPECAIHHWQGCNPDWCSTPDDALHHVAVAAYNDATRLRSILYEEDEILRRPVPPAQRDWIERHASAFAKFAAALGFPPNGERPLSDDAEVAALHAELIEPLEEEPFPLITEPLADQP